MVRTALLVLFTVACFLLLIVVINGGVPLNGDSPGTKAKAKANRPDQTSSSHDHLPGACAGCPLPSN